MSDKTSKVDLPAGCPLCSGQVRITQIRCDCCSSEINSTFEVGPLGKLPAEYQKFIAVFLRHRGNIKQVEKEIGISYPTINKMLEGVNRMLGSEEISPPPSRKEILDAIDKGEMSVKDATFILKNRK